MNKKYKGVVTKDIDVLFKGVLTGIIIGVMLGSAMTLFLIKEDNLNFIKEVSERSDNIIVLSQEVRDAERYICDLKLESLSSKAENSCMTKGYVIE